MKSKLPTTTQLSQLPLHSKMTSRWNIPKIKRTIQEWASEDKKQRALEEITMLTETPPLARTQCFEVDAAILGEHLRDYIDKGFVSPIQESEVMGMVRVFLVVEERKGKERLRLLAWPKEANDNNERYPFWLELPQPRDLARALANAHERDLHAMSLDMEIGFFQAPLQNNSAYFAFTYEGNFYCFNVLPMGWYRSVPILQSVLEAVTDACINKFNQRNALQSDLVYVDGLFVTGKHAQLVNFRKLFLKETEELGFTFDKNDEFSIPHKHGEFIGVSYDIDAGHIRLTEKFYSKLREAVRVLNLDEAPWGAQQMAVGRFLHAVRIRMTGLYKAYHLLKWYGRRTAAALRNDANSTIWKAAQKEVNDIWYEMSTNAPVSVLQHGDKEPTAILCTDASTTGGGAILIHENGTYEKLSWQWEEKQMSTDIARLELATLEMALDHFQKSIHGKVLAIRIDNTSNIGILRKTRSRVFALNNIAANIQEILDTTAAYHVAYVSTKANPADEPSRGLEPLQDKVRDVAVNVFTRRS